MIKKTLIIPDAHLSTEKPHKSYLLVKKFAKTYKPHKIVILGDFMDCVSLSHWNENKRLTLEGKRHKAELEICNTELDYWQKIGKVIYMEGNHEDFINRYIEKHPEMQGLLEIPDNCNLDKRGIQWIKYNDLYEDGHLIYMHGMYTGKYHAFKTLSTYGANVVYGHIHTPQSHTLNMRQQKPLIAQSLGCLCSHDQPYLKRRHPNWVHGFGIVETNDKTGNFNLTPVNIIDNSFIYGGTLYE